MEEIKIKLDFRGKKPISDQVHVEMLRLIQQGFLHPGDQLPTVRSLAAQLRVNFNTIARAYRILDQEGWISTQQGRGTYVVDQTEGGEPKLALTKPEQVEKLVHEMLETAARFEISPDKILQAVVRQIDVSKAKPGKARKIRMEQKKRAHFPGWYRQWRRSEKRIEQMARQFHKLSQKENAG
jgi:GntR family transcriptional regulator